MKRIALFSAVLVSALGSSAQTPAPQAAAPAHVILAPAEMKWAEGPPFFPKGMKMAVISGDPGKEGMYALRAKMPAGYTISPHWHPTDEHVTVVSGTLSLGMGDTLDKAKMKTIGTGGYALLPKEMHHYAWSKGGATIQVHGMGPFAITYVDPKDDPRNAAPAAPAPAK